MCLRETFQPILAPYNVRCTQIFSSPALVSSETYFLSYLRSSSVSSIKASTISGAMNSALPTGVSNWGVVTGDATPELNLIPDPRSKSQSLTGQSWSSYWHRMFSGFRSRWAIPFLWRNSRAEARFLTMATASLSVKNFLQTKKTVNVCPDLVILNKFQPSLNVR